MMSSIALLQSMSWGSRSGKLTLHCLMLTALGFVQLVQSQYWSALDLHPSQLTVKAGPLLRYEALSNYEIHPFPHLHGPYLQKRSFFATQQQKAQDTNDTMAAFTSAADNRPFGFTPAVVPPFRRASDSFRLQLQADGQTFYIHLEPNEHLLHPDLTSTQHHLSSLRLYKGRVLIPAHSDDIMQKGFHSDYLVPYQDEHPDDLGWARFTFRNLSPSQQADPLALVLQDVKQPLPSFEGIFTVGKELYNVKLAETYDRIRRPIDKPLDPSHGPQTLLIYKESDRKPSSPWTAQDGQSFANRSLAISQAHVASCGHDHSPFNSMKAHDFYLDKLKKHQEEERRRYKLNPLQKRAPPGCPVSKKVLYMGVAADCTYIANYGDQNNALTQIISDWNQASKLYESTFNIMLGIIKVNLVSECSTANGQSWNRPCSEGYTINNRLSDFSQWRGSQSQEAGLWHLMTKCSSGPTVGISWLNMVCETTVFPQSSDGVTEYVSGTGVSSINANEWMVVAHEIGHNFGARHDCTSSLCGQCSGNSDQCSCCACSPGCDCDSQFIMNPTADVKSSAFSPCSIRDICTKFPVQGTCLQEPGSKTTITGNQCGNGVKEPGEQCDCGPAAGTDCLNDPCCDGATCKLKNGAMCDDFNDGCCRGCQIKSAGDVCRPSQGFCDFQETCDGKSGSCARDSFRDDLSPCSLSDGSAGQCASGQCTSRDLQCQLRGTLAGITKECPGFGASCNLYCQSPSKSNVCLQISGFFTDGTSCGVNGKCVQGVCKAEGLNNILTWAQGNLAIAIVILVVVIIVVIALISRCLQICQNRRKPLARSPAQSAAVLPSLQHRNHPHTIRSPQQRPSPLHLHHSVLQHGQPAINQQFVHDVPQHQRSSTSPRSAAWVDPRAYNGDVDADGLDPEIVQEVQTALSRPSQPSSDPKSPPSRSNRLSRLPSSSVTYTD